MATTRYIDSAMLPTAWGDFQLHGFEEVETGKEHVALTMGEFSPDEPVLLRIHSECLTGDAFFSQRCDCGPQLQAALKAIAAEGKGIVLYLRQEGRGIGLLNKIRAYHLQDEGADTVEANEQLGFGADEREYGMCKTMLEHLSVKRVRLMTNNPTKMAAVESLGFIVDERIPLWTENNPHNEQYIATKSDKMGHLNCDH